MRIAEIAKIERQNEQQIHWFKSGMFWRAYNLSAFLTIQNGRPFKVIYKAFKVTQWEALLIGFPESVCQDLLQQFSKIDIQREPNHICIHPPQMILKEAYMDWFESHCRMLNRPSSYQYLEVIERLKSFPLANKTPIESQHFLWELQKIIHG